MQITLSIAEAAKLLKVHPTTCYRYVRAGLFPAINIAGGLSGKTLIPSEDVFELIRKRRNAAVAGKLEMETDDYDRAIKTLNRLALRAAEASGVAKVLAMLERHGCQRIADIPPAKLRSVRGSLLRMCAGNRRAY